MMRAVLVTGGGGFLGTAIIKALRQTWPDLEIRSFSRQLYPHLQTWSVKSWQGDLSQAESLRAATLGVDAVIHTAAKAGVWGRDETYEQTNVQGTREVIEACLSLGVRYLIYTSSPSVTFSGRDQCNENEDAPYPQHFLNAYSRTKAEAEKMILEHHSKNLHTLALRPHLLWGPGDPHLVQRIIDRARKGKLRLIQRGRPCLVDATYIDNAAAAHISALQALVDQPRQAGGKAYFIANDEPQDLNALIRDIAEACRVPLPTKYVSPQLAWLLGSSLEFLYKVLGLRREPVLTRFVAKQLSTDHWFNLSQAKALLHYRPLVSTREGLERLRDSHKLQLYS
jgi:nucleoside-diphosphate-sugar epimerase